MGFLPGKTKNVFVSNFLTIVKKISYFKYSRTFWQTSYYENKWACSDVKNVDIFKKKYFKYVKVPDGKVLPHLGV